MSQVASKNFGELKERIGEYKGAGKAAGAVAVVEGGRRLVGSGSPAASNADRNSDNRINPADFPTYRRGTKSAKAFQKAFTEAAQQGDKTFRFEGRVYNTKKLLKKLDIDMQDTQAGKTKRVLNVLKDPSIGVVTIARNLAKIKLLGTDKAPYVQELKWRNLSANDRKLANEFALSRYGMTFEKKARSASPAVSAGVWIEAVAIGKALSDTKL